MKSTKPSQDSASASTSASKQREGSDLSPQRGQTAPRQSLSQSQAEQRTEAPQESARELTQRMMQVQQHCMADFSTQLNEAKLSYAQYYLLGVLSGIEGLSMGDIADRMGHSTAAATGLVDRLERLDLVERRTSTKDRRRIVVGITENGQQSLNKLNESMVSSVAKLLAEEKQ